MSGAYESLIFHDATEERLRYLVEAVVVRLKQGPGWLDAIGDLPGSAGMRVPWTSRSWGERVTLAVEEKSIRVVSRCAFPVQIVDWGKNRKNVEQVRLCLRHVLAETSSTSPSDV